MDYVLYCRLSHFYTRLLGLDSDRPCAVIRERVVLDANACAIHRGVVPGMALTQARTILREDGLFRTLRDEEGQDEQNRWLDGCTGFTGVIEPEDRHSAFIDLSAHPNPFDVAQKLLAELEALSGCEVRFGVGASKWLARLSADLDGGHLTPLDAVGMAEMRIENLTPVELEHRERLRFLGYHSIGLVANLPISTLRGQFGDDGLRIQLAAKGSWAQPVQALYPPDSLKEILIFDGSTDDALMLDEALVSLSQRIGKRLLTAERQATETHVELETEDGERTHLSRRFNKPLRCPRTAVVALRLLVEKMELTQPVQSVAVRLPVLERSKNIQQSLLGTLTKAQTTSRAEDALRQVRGVFGEQSIQVAGSMTLSRRVKVMREWKNATGWR